MKELKMPRICSRTDYTRPAKGPYEILMYYMVSEGPFHRQKDLIRHLPPISGICVYLALDYQGNDGNLHNVCIVQCRGFLGERSIANFSGMEPISPFENIPFTDRGAKWEMNRAKPTMAGYMLCREGKMNPDSFIDELIAFIDNDTEYTVFYCNQYPAEIR